MTRLLLIVFVFTSLLSKAQIVNIPDSNFKQMLINPTYDLNQDGEIEVNEALKITQLYISTNNPIRDFTGIREFKNLVDLRSLNNKTGDIDISGLPFLEIFSSHNDSITKINLSGCNNLKTIDFLDGKLASLDVRGLNKLQSIQVFDNLLTSFQHGTLDSLGYLALTGNLLTALDVSNCKNLTYLDISFNNGNIGMNHLNISGLTKLESFTPICNIRQLNASNCTKLSNLGLGLNSAINYLDVTGCTGLTSLGIVSDSIQNLDLSTCTRLSSFNITSSSIRSINLKNGSALAAFNFELNANEPINICADEFEIDTIQSFLNNRLPNNLITVSSYCTLSGGGNYNSIYGKVKFDDNNNGCNSTDPGMGGVKITVTDTSGNSTTRFTSAAGDYAHYPYKGIFTITPQFANSYFQITPPVATVTFDTANNLVDTASFCLSAAGIYNDLEITMVPTWPPARPGFDAGYNLIYKNKGTTTLSGNIQLNFDNNKVNFVSASEPVSTQITGQITWSFNNLTPFESRMINTTFNLLPPPVNNITDTLTYLAYINTAVKDETEADNSFVLTQPISGSYDPNDKKCLEGDKLPISQLADFLHYQVHFQNEGTDTAFNIVVVDTLANNFDAASFEFTGSSHPCTVKLNKNKVEFAFKDIRLPYKAINEAASNGYVAFKIKPTTAVAIGDSLNNRAAIYFDFNLPVITNTAKTFITNPLAPGSVQLVYFSLSTGNNGNILNWKVNCREQGSISFVIEKSSDGIHFTTLNSMNLTTEQCSLPLNFTDITAASKNFYRIKITGVDGSSFYSKTLQTGGSSSGTAFKITSIVNDIVYVNSNTEKRLLLKLIAMDGRIVYSSNKIIPAGQGTINLQLKKIPAGIYTLAVYADDGEIITRKFLK